MNSTNDVPIFRSSCGSLFPLCVLREWSCHGVWMIKTCWDECNIGFTILLYQFLGSCSSSNERKK